MTTFKIWFCGIVLASAFIMMLYGVVKASPGIIELCNWG